MPELPDVEVFRKYINKKNQTEQPGNLLLPPMPAISTRIRKEFSSAWEIDHFFVLIKFLFFRFSVTKG